MYQKTAKEIASIPDRTRDLRITSATRYHYAIEAIGSLFGSLLNAGLLRIIIYLDVLLLVCGSKRCYQVLPNVIEMLIICTTKTVNIRPVYYL